MIDNCQICTILAELKKWYIKALSAGGLETETNICRICNDCFANAMIGEVIVVGYHMDNEQEPILMFYHKGEPPVTDPSEMQ